MSLFTQSTTTFASAILQIADSVGASADTEMTTRAFRSLNAAILYFNGRARWDFLLVEAAPQTIVGAFTITGCTASAGMTSALAPVGHGLLVDDLVNSTNILPQGTRISATAAGSVGLNASFSSGIGAGNVVVSLGCARDMYPLPADFKAYYSVRLYGVSSTLRPLRRRFYIRSVTNEFAPSTPIGYDPFPVGALGKIRLLPPPSSPDNYTLNYFRRMTVATASGDTGTLDIQQDYDPYLIAWAKWHFIMDKGEGRSEQADKWKMFADEGLKIMLADNATLPDEDLMFTPGAFTYSPQFGPNQTRTIDWLY